MAAMPRDSGVTSDDLELTDAVSMLTDALQILDSHGVPPQIGARLQGVIDDLVEFSASSPTGS